MKRITTLLLLVLTAAAATLSAADVNFTVKVPPRVFVGDRFAVTYRLTNASGSDLRVPAIEGCKLLYGPSQSTSQSYQIINGHPSSSSSVDYTYYYKAEKEGDYKIPAASIVADGKRLSTQPVSFRIAAAIDHSQPASSRPVDVDDVDSQAAGRHVNSDDVFVRIILNKSTAYEQEAITCTIKLYTKYNISSFMTTRQPAFDGFLIEEQDVQAALNQRETYRGQDYTTAVLKQCIIFPQKSGKLTINSGNYDISVVQYENVNMGMFQMRQPREQKIKVSSNSASIDIKPLPSPAPEGFSGAVGTFSIDSRLVGNNFRTNDPATLIYTISGTGNIKYLKEPEIDFPSEFELYSPKSDIDTHIVGNDVKGTMTVEYTFVPQSVGNFTIGSDKFVYFNPSSGQYVTLSTPTYPIKVAKGLSTPSATEDQKAIENKNSDIRHIYLGEKNPSFDHTLVVTRPYYWILYIILIVGAGGYILFNRQAARRNADIAGTRLARASKVARKRFKAAAGFLKSKDSDKFYEEMLRALWGYLSDKLAIPTSQLTRQNISDALARKGYPSTVIDPVISVIDDCEMARYTPGASTRMESVYDAGVSAVNNLESFKK